MCVVCRNLSNNDSITAEKIWTHFGQQKWSSEDIWASTNTCKFIHFLLKCVCHKLKNIAFPQFHDQYMTPWVQKCFEVCPHSKIKCIFRKNWNVLFHTIKKQLLQCKAKYGYLQVYFLTLPSQMITFGNISNSESKFFRMNCLHFCIILPFKMFDFCKYMHTDLC